jgi:hypothetical protein
MWSDNETPIDYLGFQHLVTSINSIVMDDALCPATIGVFGDWGSGKSSLLEMTKEELEKDNTLLVLTFNGWLFEGYEDAKVALMGTILDGVKSRATLTAKGKRLLFKLFNRINWFKLLGTGAKHTAAYAVGGAAGLGISVTADSAKYISEAANKIANLTEEDLEKIDPSQFLKDDRAEEIRKAAQEFRDDFEALLNETKLRRVVIVIDDLDRCFPDTIIETLEAIKLFLFVKNSAFIIGADERLVKYAVRRRFPELPGERTEVGRDYLEKLIQFPVRIPPLNACEVETYINMLFASKTSLPNGAFEKVRTRVLQCNAESLMTVRFNHGVASEVLGQVPEELIKDLALAERLAPILATGLNGNPRQCKRFLNTLIMRMNMAESRKLTLQKRILAKLMLLEYLKPEYFQKLAAAQAVEDGRPRILRQLEHAVVKDSKNQAQVSESSLENGGSQDKKKRETSKETTGEVAIEKPSFDLGEFAGWLKDEWMHSWLASEPTLSAEDLRPYFYFSRDTLDQLGSAVRRMTPRAQEMLGRLLHASDAIRQLAIEEVKSLIPADAAAIFEAIAVRVTQEEGLGSGDSVFSRLFDLAGVRSELRPQLTAFLDRLPVADIPFDTIPKIINITKDTETEPATRRLMEKWHKNTSNPRLATLAGKQFSRLKE